MRDLESGVPVFHTTCQEMGKMPAGFTGITYTPGRPQPYAVWVRGWIHAYSTDEAGARAIASYRENQLGRPKPRRRFLIGGGPA